MNTVRIFIASSSELEADRKEFKGFIYDQNTRLSQQGIYLEIVQWENFLDAISDTRLQDEYNKALRDCDIALCLFFTKVGKYSAEEFDTAYQVFKDTGKPKIWTYFKDAPVNTGSITEEINTLINFKKKIGDLGHFYTKYTGIDNLINQFRNQLDKFLPQFGGHADRESEPTGNKAADDATEPPINNFNEILTRRLIEAIQEDSPRARKFLENANRMANNWETQERFSDPAKEIIAFSYVGVIGIQLRKLMAIGKELFSEKKQIKYIENCLLTSKRPLQLICFALISKLWDIKRDTDFTLSPEEKITVKNFFEDEFELDLTGFVRLLGTLLDIYAANLLELPITELNEFKQHLQPDADFLKACLKLQEVSSQAEQAAFTLADCSEAESSLTTVLSILSFLASYKMVSIKNIGYFEMRNTTPHYLYNYTALGIDNKSNVNQDRVNYAEAPINTDAVLLYKGTYQQNVNLFPFIIDINALSAEGGAKICFYTSYDNNSGSLNYCFLEDNSTVKIKDNKTLTPGSDINELLLDPNKRKDMRFDTVFTIFREAKITITGLEEEEAFTNPF